jgi:hypothetical protein
MAKMVRMLGVTSTRPSGSLLSEGDTRPC